MRCSGWSSLAISACSVALALTFAGGAAAHVVAAPTYVPSKGKQDIVFSGPNERQKPMTAFTLIAPEGLQVVHAHPVGGWTERFTAQSATWTGGSLAPRADIPFRVTLKATAKPGILTVQAQQKYADGGIVTWPVSLTVVPAQASPSENFAMAGIVGLLGVAIVAVIGLVAWRRRPSPLAGGEGESE